MDTARMDIGAEDSETEPAERDTELSPSANSSTIVSSHFAVALTQT
jgi:hypothetical protein